MPEDPPPPWTGALACPIPREEMAEISLAHGGGGRLMQELVSRVFAASFAPLPTADSAIFAAPGARIAFTTDSFVVNPLEFPGGDIARLAVFGTCNDLAVCGAEPSHLAVALVLEEGLEMALLWRLCRSLAAAAREAGVSVVTGDTKVVERGKGDGLYITTTGLGRVVLEPSAGLVAPGDAVLVSGDVGRHGIAVLTAREAFGLEGEVVSDLALLWPAVAALHAAGIAPRWMRDATRGGLATVLVELASTAGLQLEIDEAAVPVTQAVAAACELLGFDPLYVANEGCMAIVVPSAQAAVALAVLRALPAHAGAACIGRVTGRGTAQLVARSPIGGRRLLRLLSGEQLPRIC